MSQEMCGSCWAEEGQSGPARPPGCPHAHPTGRGQRSGSGVHLGASPTMGCFPGKTLKEDERPEGFLVQNEVLSLLLGESTQRF